MLRDMSNPLQETSNGMTHQAYDTFAHLAVFKISFEDFEGPCPFQACNKKTHYKKQTKQN